MEDGIVVSVYCLAYNHEQYIRDALEGFVRQKTNFRYEVLVHDDASTDNTPAIIWEYAQKYPDIIKPIFQTENQYSKGVKILPEIIHPKSSGRYSGFSGDTPRRLLGLCTQHKSAGLQKRRNIPQKSLQEG